MISFLAALELVLEVALIQGLVLAVLFFFRRISAALQHRLLAAAVLAVIVVSVASAFVPARRLGIIPVGDAASYGGAMAPAGAPPAAGVPAASGLAPEPAPAATPRRSTPTTLGTVWLAGSALVLVWILGGMAYGWRLSAQARSSQHAHLTDRFRWALEQMGVRSDIPLVESERVRVPVVFGWMRPKVILPARAAHWPEDRLEAVLLHESAHVRRRDLAYQFLAKLMCALYWFNPLAWLVERKLFLAGERAADDQVIGRKISASDYAEHLMATSEELGVARTPLWATAAMAEGTDFKDRILSILDPNVKRGEPTLTERTILALVAGSVIISVVALSPWRAASLAPAPLSSESVTDAPRSAEASPPQADQAAPGDLPTLVAMLRMQDASIREHAATALGQLGDARGVEPLVDVVLGDAVAAVREHAASALGVLGDARALDPLLQVSRRDRNARVREHAVTAVGRLGDRRAYEFLLETMRGHDVEEVRVHAAYALGLLGDRRALEPLLEALRDGDPRMRANAAQGLGELGDARALDALRGAWSDPDENVRASARQAMDKIRGGS